MQQTLFLPQQTLRFARWSRKGYAMFASLGRCVSIAVVRSEIADSSLSKSLSMQLVPAAQQQREAHLEDDNTVNDGFTKENVPLLQQLLALLVLSHQAEITPCNPYFIKHTKKVWMDCCLTTTPPHLFFDRRREL